MFRLEQTGQDNLPTCLGLVASGWTWRNLIEFDVTYFDGLQMKGIIGYFNELSNYLAYNLASQSFDMDWIG